MQIINYDGSDYSGSVIVAGPYAGGVTTWMVNAMTMLTDWDNGVPDNTMTAIIDAPYNSSTASLEVSTLTITANGDVNIAAGDFISTQKDITNDGNLSAVHTGSIVQILPNAVTVNNNTIDVNVATPMLDPRDFMLLGSPMSMEVKEELSGFRILQHDTNQFDMFNDMTLADATNFVHGNGNDWTPNIGVLAPSEGFYYIPRYKSCYRRFF
ncbi:hypothetical protein [Patiriisocius sp. Uisw_017]|jgi:hypothetical protein|uniref:hypothetical protein n=1 Tax=Patiriisocius sp. Uisw_017 TaxID=3230968 RepID=UPI0039E785E6